MPRKASQTVMKMERWRIDFGVSCQSGSHRKTKENEEIRGQEAKAHEKERLQT
jgi:hypothetical protein